MTPAWKKGTRSGTQGNCVEVARLGDDEIGVRDSKDPDGPVLRFTREQWQAFLDAIVDDEIDV